MAAFHGNAASVLTPVNPLLLRGFRLIASRRMRKAFRAVRVAGLERFPTTTGPVIVYLNHPSWWDPLTSFVLAPHLIGRRNFYGPIEAASLERYGILRRLGLFPVEVDTPRGAVQFLRAAETVLNGGGVLGLTPQGRFTDARERPPVLRDGLGALLSRMQRQGRSTAVVPLAIEYTFWDQRLPEALACVGQPIVCEPGTPPEQAVAAEAWTERLAAALAETQDELRDLALTRDAGRFTTVLHGRPGAAGFYGLWEAVRGKIGKSLSPADHVSQSGPRSS